MVDFVLKMRFYKESLRLTFLSIVVFFVVSWEMGYPPLSAVVRFVRFVCEDPLEAVKYLPIVWAGKIVLFMIVFIVSSYVWRWVKKNLRKTFVK